METVAAPGRAAALQQATARGGTIAQAGELRSVRVEAIRALAALGVVVCHTYAIVNGAHFGTYHSRVLVGMGNIGVDLFFALSGYLIFLPFARRDFGNGPRIDLRTYVLNRGLRLLPLYYVVLVIVGSINGASLHEFARFALFAENFRADSVARGIDGVMWSLVVEIHFYVLLPLLAWALARTCRGSARQAGVVIAVLGVGSVVAFEVALGAGAVWLYELPSNFVFFVPGMLLALARASADEHPSNWSGRWWATADLWLLTAIALWLSLFIVPEWEFRLLPAATIGTLLTVATAVLPVPRGTLARILDLRILGVVGVASYSLYLWHVPVLYWLPHSFAPGVPSWLLFLAFAVPVCVAVALVSYSVIEAPPLRLRRRWFAGSTAPQP